MFEGESIRILVIFESNSHGSSAGHIMITRPNASFHVSSFALLLIRTSSIQFLFKNIKPKKILVTFG